MQKFYVVYIIDLDSKGTTFCPIRQSKEGGHHKSETIGFL
jgi:hypothetical protein